MFNDTSRYLDDIFTINNPEFEKHSPDIYPAELQLNKANTSDKETSFLDLNIKVIGTSVYDKRVELFKTLEIDGKENKISTRKKKFHFWVKNAVFIKNENKFLKNYDFWYTWSNDHIQKVFQVSERSDQYSRRYDMLNFHPIGITLFCIETIQNNAISERIRIEDVITPRILIRSF